MGSSAGATAEVVVPPSASVQPASPAAPTALAAPRFSWVNPPSFGGGVVQSFTTRSGTLWAIGPNGLLLRKLARAAAWERIELAAPYDLAAIWADDEGVVIALARDNEDTIVLRSETGGDSFTAARQSKLNLSMVVGRGAELFLATSSGTLLLSSDRGKTFAVQDKLEAWLQVGFAAPTGELYWGGSGGELFVSPAVGQPFTALSSGTSDEISAIASDGKALLIGGGKYLGAGQLRGMLRVSEDQGQSFTNVGIAGDEQIGALTFAQGAWFAVTGRDQLFRAAFARGPFKEVPRSTSDVAPPGTALVVGRDGDLYFPKAQGGAWSLHTASFRDELSDVWGRSEREVFAVGMEVTVERPLPGGQSFKGVILSSLDGAQTWKGTRFESIQSLSGVCGSERGPVFAVGSAGKAVALRGPTKGWEPLELKTELDLNDCLVTASGTVLMIGAKGLVLRSTDEGRSFANVNAGVTEDLRFIEQDEKGVVQVHSGQTLLRSNDEGLSFTVGPTTVERRPSARLADGSELQLNTRGGAIEWLKDGRVLQTQPTGARALTAVWAGKSLMVVVGDQGAVLTAKR